MALIHLFKKAGWLLCLAILLSCNFNKKHTPEAKNQTEVTVADSLKSAMFNLNELSWPEDSTDTSSPSEIRSVKSNFKRINAIGKWTQIVKKDLEDSAEGGELVFYYLNGQLEKMATRQFGEHFQVLAEYYLLNGSVSFVIERTITYNRPIYYDSIAMKANNDNQVFDIEKSEWNDIRSYFADGKLIQQFNNFNRVVIDSTNLLAEQNRLLYDFDALKKME